jgi:hypothetical protein
MLAVERRMLSSRLIGRVEGHPLMEPRGAGKAIGPYRRCHRLSASVARHAAWLRQHWSPCPAGHLAGSSSTHLRTSLRSKASRRASMAATSAEMRSRRYGFHLEPNAHALHIVWTHLSQRTFGLMEHAAWDVLPIPGEPNPSFLSAQPDTPAAMLPGEAENAAQRVSIAETKE